ncbi:MAG: hypothetical protein IKW10_05195 [Oscillospiraceae bacterium]|nr:hypothetical protein [Oscillospiraceae bacterium]
MKENKEKKPISKWLVIVLAACLLVAAAACVFFLSGSDPQEEPLRESRLYWNVEGKSFRNGTNIRYVSDDGYVYMIFSVDGIQERVPVANYELATAIDMLDVVGLEFDKNGVAVDYLRASEFTGGILANKFFVTEITDNQVTCNSSVTLGGYDVTFELTAETPVYDVGTEGITCGIPGVIKEQDQITVVAGKDGSILAVFVYPYAQPGDLYWSVSRKYDSVVRHTTREPDVAGFYTYEMLCNGQQVTVQTRDYEVASQMDSFNAPCMGLTFDENGYVIEAVHATKVTEGRVFASYSRVMQVSGNMLYTKKLTGTGVGTEYSALLSEDCKIINTTSAGVRGEYTDLRYGDQIHALTDGRGKVCYVFITSRVCVDEYGFCWNFDYKSGATETERKPDANGVYHIKLACDGVVFTGWTKDLDKVNMLDTSRFRGVKLGEDKEILDVIPSNYVYGGSHFCSWYYVDKIEGDQITVSFTKTAGGETKVLTGTISKDVQVYNTSKMVSHYQGEVSTVQVGDQIYAQNDMHGQIRAIYVVNRYLKAGVYYNLERKWSDSKEETTRVPDANGDYVFRMAHEGKQVTIKTRSKQVANDIDSQVAKVLGLVVDKNGYCTKAVHAKETEECKGSVTVSYVLVTAIRGNQVDTLKPSTGEKKTIYLAKDAKFMDVSALYDDHQGEYTKLRKGDKIHCLADQDKNTNYVYITDRYFDGGVYYNLDRKWDDENKCTTRVPEANGLYSFRLAHKGIVVTLQTKSLAVANAIDSQVANVVALQLDKNGLITKAVHGKEAEECKGGVTVSYVIVTKISGNQVTTYKESTGETKTITLAADAQFINVSKMYDSYRGEYTKLRLGDKIHCLAEESGKTNYVYITSRKPVVVDHTCQQGSANTVWYAYNPNAGFTENGHYVLTKDLTLPKRITIGADQEITLCLNGHTITSEDRVFSIYGKLTICDHKHDGVYAGRIISNYSNSVDAEGNIVKVYGGLAYLYNEEQNAELNIYGGNFIHVGTTTAAGLVYVANKSDSGYSAVFNLYDGILSGGTATDSGGAVAVRNVGVFNMYGGKILDCKAATGAGVHLQSANAVFRMENGLIENCHSTDVGAGICIGNGTAYMTGGTVTGCTTTGNGGSVNITAGSFTMTGGSLLNGQAKEGGNLRVGGAASFTLGGNALISCGNATNGGNAVVYGTLQIQDQAVMENGTATNKGGNINAFANLEDAIANIIMTGGTVSGGVAGVDSGSVRLDANAGTVNMTVTGGTISGGSAPHASGVRVGTAEHIYMTLGGSPVIDEIYLEAGKQITTQTMDVAASVGISMAQTNGAFTVVTDAQQGAVFHAYDSQNARVENVDNTLYLNAWHHHCVCGGNLTGTAQQAHSANCVDVEEWTPLSKESFEIGEIFVAASTSGRVNFAQPTGHYYLTENVSTKYVIEILKGTDVTLCLNGHTLTSTATGNSAIRLSGKLTICDCAGGGKITAKSPKAPGMIFMLTSTADSKVGTELNLYGGDLVMTDNNYTANAGVIQVGNSGNNPGVFNMYGGSISGGTANKGGNILIGTAAATMNLYGGLVEGGSVKTNDTSTDRNRGGNIYVNKGTLNVYGGIISGGKTTADDPNPGLGGDIYMTGGKVQFFIPMENLDIDGDGTGQLILPETGSDREDP